MKYVPLRVYSVFSRGKGAVDARVLGEFLSQRGVPALAVTDPFMMAGWECFREEAVKYNLKPLLGIEIRLRNIGALVLYPISVKGYFSLVSSYNRKVFSAMEDVIAVCVLNRGLQVALLFVLHCGYPQTGCTWEFLPGTGMEQRPGSHRPGCPAWRAPGMDAALEMGGEPGKIRGRFGGV